MTAEQLNQNWYVHTGARSAQTFLDSTTKVDVSLIKCKCNGTLKHEGFKFTFYSLG